MADVSIFDAGGKKSETMNVDDRIADSPVNRSLLKQVILAYQNNTKLGTANTKTRSEMSFSGEKPWRQKGTGRARSGTRSSPIWRSGAVAFGPRTFRRRQKTTARMKKAALQQSIGGKIRSGEVMLFKDMGLDSPSTKKISGFLNALGVIGSSILLITDNDIVYRSARNIQRVNVKAGAYVNALDLLSHKYIVADTSGFEQLLERAQK